MISWFFRLILKLWGWKKVGETPNHIPKKLYVVVPHTSNWDFPLGICIKFGYKMEVGFIAKASLFKFPYAWFFKSLGGIPVNRKKTQGFKEAVVEMITSRERFCTSIAPEGRRGRVEKLKTGFYHISKAANIPIIYVKFDWGKKIIEFGEPRMVAETVKEELDYAAETFKDTVGYVPEKSFGYPFDKTIS